MKKVTGGALPALAWHEFMVAAHEGVPVAQLPGGWSGARPAWSHRNRWSMSAGRASRHRSRSARSCRPSGPSRLRQNAASPDETASIRRPSADVGGGKRTKRQTSILDVILGTGQ